MKIHTAVFLRRDQDEPALHIDILVGRSLARLEPKIIRFLREHIEEEKLAQFKDADLIKAFTEGDWLCDYSLAITEYDLEDGVKANENGNDETKDARPFNQARRSTEMGGIQHRGSTAQWNARRLLAGHQTEEGEKQMKEPNPKTGDRMDIHFFHEHGWDEMAALEKQLKAAIGARVAEFAEGALRVYGPNAADMLRAALPVIWSSPLAGDRHGRIVLHHEPDGQGGWKRKEELDLNEICSHAPGPDSGTPGPILLSIGGESTIDDDDRPYGYDRTLYRQVYDAHGEGVLERIPGEDIWIIRAAIRGSTIALEEYLDRVKWPKGPAGKETEIETITKGLQTLLSACSSDAIPEILKRLNDDPIGSSSDPEE